MYQRKCKAEINQDVEEEESGGEEEDGDKPEQMGKQKANQNSHKILKKKMMMTLLCTELIYLKGLMSFLEFRVNMVYVWSKQMLKRRKEVLY